MKKWLIALTLLTGLSGVAYAGAQHHEKMVNKLIEKLELDDGRANEVRSILDASREQKAALREEMREKKKVIHANTKQNLATVLTEEEMAKFEKIMEKKRKKMKEHHRDSH